MFRSAVEVLHSLLFELYCGVCWNCIMFVDRKITGMHFYNNKFEKGPITGKKECDFMLIWGG